MTNFNPDHTSLHQHALRSLEEADVLLAHMDTGVNEVHRFDMITTEWLKNVLSTGVVGAQIQNWERVGGHNGMTNRHKLRITWNKIGTEADLPRAIFMKVTPPDANLREMLSMLHMAELECNLYNVCYKDLSDLIPKCYYAQSYPGGRFVILLEDLDERNIEVHWMGDDVSIDYAKAVAVAQGKIHARFWNSPRFHTDMVWVRPRPRRFGENWLRQQFHQTRNAFLDIELGKTCSPKVRELIKEWDQHCDLVYDYFDQKPPTLVHGDSHLGNVLKFTDGTAGYYDWQCLFRSYGFRDLAYFLNSALTLDDAKAHERDIFDLYVVTLKDNGVTVNPEEAWLDYNLLRMDRFDSAMMSTTSAGGYGHAARAFERQVKTISWAVEEYDVPSLLARLVKTGSPYPLPN